MIKKILMSATLAAIMCAISVPANAQFGKALKGLGKAAKETATNMASDAVANQVAQKVVNYMDQQNTVAAADSEYAKRLETIVGNYKSVDGITLNYKVYENPEMNILACADGSIRIYSGMMDSLTNDEVLAVIATQIGHIANKDARNSLLQVASGDNAEKATSAQLEKMLSMSGDGLGTIINELLQVPYTLDQNKAADIYAVKFLKSNKKDASALASALTKFADMEVADAEAAEADEFAETSPAAKYISVNKENAIRASLIAD